MRCLLLTQYGELSQVPIRLGVVGLEAAIDCPGLLNKGSTELVAGEEILIVGRVLVELILKADLEVRF